MKSHTAMGTRRAALVACGLALAACASLPTLSFEQDSGTAVQGADSGTGDPVGTPDDAASDSAVGSSSGGVAHDSGADTGPVVDAAKPDTGAPGGICPIAPPSGADSCCGAIACVGKKCSTRCTDCTSTCAVTEVCCAPNGNGNAVTCTSSVADCN